MISLENFFVDFLKRAAIIIIQLLRRYGYEEYRNSDAISNWFMDDCSFIYDE
jgi:hypothetical protein